MIDWLATLHATLLRGEAVVRVIVTRGRGSAPREQGACMLVTAEGQHGTIGGGHLEHVATSTARDMLAAPCAPRIDRFSLGASLGQCCGGIVELGFVRYDAGDLAPLEAALAARGADPAATFTTPLGGVTFSESLALDVTDLWLFGAGHVGRALVAMLAELPFRITWVDSREDTPATVHGDPAEAVAAMPAGAWALVMTHSHDEDYAICEALLERGDAGWIGLIGSAPKATRFRQKLAHRGFSPEAIARVTSPIGIRTIGSKLPAAIAVSVAAQLLQLRESRASATARHEASA